MVVGIGSLMFISQLSTAVNALLFGFILNKQNGNAVSNLGLVVALLTLVNFIGFTMAEFFEKIPIDKSGVPGLEDHSKSSLRKTEESKKELFNS